MGKVANATGHFAIHDSRSSDETRVLGSALKPHRHTCTSAGVSLGLTGANATQ
ncbi:hypothetical protein HAX54_039114, partial [Datura stramonium]|nr:hypothetical protein [Datura stramonium]